MQFYIEDGASSGVSRQDEKKDHNVTYGLMLVRLFCLRSYLALPPRITEITKKVSYSRTLTFGFMFAC